LETVGTGIGLAVQARGHSPTDKAAMKLVFLVMNRSKMEWKLSPRK